MNTPKECSICGTTDQKRRIYNNNELGVVCNRCYCRHRDNPITYEPSKYGELSYNDDGKPICHVCGKAYDKLMSHAWQIHKLSAYDYKKKYGLETTKGIMSDTSKEIARNRNAKNYDKVVKYNLIQKGERTRFKNGHKGRIKSKLSEQTRQKLSNRLIQMNADKIAN